MQATYPETEKIDPAPVNDQHCAASYAKRSTPMEAYHIALRQPLAEISWNLFSTDITESAESHEAMGIMALTGAIGKEAELSERWVCSIFCFGLAGREKETVRGKGDRPSAPSSTGCFQDADVDECNCGEGGLLTMSQSELRTFSRGRRPSIQILSSKS